MPKITKEGFEKQVKDEKWSVNRAKYGTFINCGNLCVAQVTESAAEEIVGKHNERIDKEGA